MAAVQIETIDLENTKDDDVVLIPNENEDDSLTEKARELAAEKHKEVGNTQYKLKQYSKALKCYTEAINICPAVAAYYGNRSACYMMLGMYTYALDDAKHALSLDPKFSKALIRQIKCNIALGDVPTAHANLKTLAELDPSNPAIAQETKAFEAMAKNFDGASKAFSGNDYRTAMFYLDRAMDLGVACKTYKLMKAECLAHLNRLQEAQEIANSILATDKQNPDAVFVRGLCLYYDDKMDLAANHFQLLLKLAPDHAKAKETYKRAKLLKAKKDEGNVKFVAGNNQEAFDIYTEALKIDARNININSKLLHNRATVLFRMGKYNEAIADCTLALEKDPNYLKALIRRSKCFYELGQYKECVQDAEKINKMDSSRENRAFLEDAKRLLKRSEVKDYYKILGVTKNASSDDIKKAYRKRALVHHPDRHTNATHAEKQEQEKLFKEVGEAYGILSDPTKRSRYDRGEDVMEEGGMGGHAGANLFEQHLFQTYFDPTGGRGGSGVRFQYYQ
uniref:DnaJ homolog subfamily C member 7 n=1 Tax=Cacopsylla melanoneura TaxID=428564 RepID=A0A8D8UDQ7_9HEMI